MNVKSHALPTKIKEQLMLLSGLPDDYYANDMGYTMHSFL